METNYNVFYDYLNKTKEYQFNSDFKDDLEVEFKLNKTTFKGCSEREIINYLFKKIQDLEDKMEEKQNDNLPNGFFTLSKSLADIWDNEEEDEWEKYV